MPIQYRCQSCGQLLSISTRRLGHTVDCPMCGNPTVVIPLDDDSYSPSIIQAPAEPFAIAPKNAELLGEKPADFVEPAPPAAPREPIAAVEPAAAAKASIPVPRAAPKTSARGREHAAPRVELLESDMVEEDGGFQVRRPQTTFDDMDLTPMVDVTFLLLIFFMVTASFSLQKTIDIPAPDQNQKGATQSLSLEDLEDNTVMVRIDDKNLIFIDDEPVADRAKLADLLTHARLSTLRSEVAIDAHADTLHETVITVIDAATEAGMQRIRLVSRTGSG